MMRCLGNEKGEGDTGKVARLSKTSNDQWYIRGFAKLKKSKNPKKNWK